MTLLGWTISQWAEAAGWFNSTLPPANLDGARLVRRNWLASRAAQPGENLLVMAEKPMNFGWATSMMVAATKELVDSNKHFQP